MEEYGWSHSWQSRRKISGAYGMVLEQTAAYSLPFGLVHVSTPLVFWDGIVHDLWCLHSNHMGLFEEVFGCPYWDERRISFSRVKLR